MKVLVALLVVLFLPCSVAKADTVEFTNGSKIHGKTLVGAKDGVWGSAHDRKLTFLKPGRMRVVFKNGGWFEFNANTVKNVEINDLDEFEWRKDEVKPDPNVDGKIRLEVKSQNRVN